MSYITDNYIHNNLRENEMDISEFEEYEGEYSQYYVTIIKSGQIHMKKHLVEWLNINDSKDLYAKLLFNKRTKEIAIKFIEEKTLPNIMKVQKRIRVPFRSDKKIVTSAYISCYKFLRMNQILPDKAVRFSAKKQDGYVIIETNYENNL